MPTYSSFDASLLLFIAQLPSLNCWSSFLLTTIQGCTWFPVTGCQLCPDSDFINDCQGCDVEGCQLSCDSCLSSNRTTGPPVVFTIPDGGCVASSTGTSGIECKNGTEGSCPLGEQQLFPYGFANTSCCYPSETCVDAGCVLHQVVVHVLVCFCVYSPTPVPALTESAKLHDCKCAFLAALHAYCKQQYKQMCEWPVHCSSIATQARAD